MLWGDTLLITQEQFDKMKYEILECKPSKYDMLCEIAIQYLKPQINSWCASDIYLKGRDEAEDILNNTIIRLMQRVVTNFFSNEYRYAKDGNDVKRFAGWTQRVAFRIYMDYSTKISGGKDRSFLSFEDICSEGAGLGGRKDTYDKERTETYLLDIAKNQIMELDVKPYKIIAWLAVYVFMLAYNFTKIEANRYIDNELSKFSLYEAYDFILDVSKKIRWLEFTEEQKNRISDALKEAYDEKRIYADISLEELYMKKGGLKSLSDWWNKMNKMIDWSKSDDE